MDFLECKYCVLIIFPSRNYWRTVWGECEKCAEEERQMCGMGMPNVEMENVLRLASGNAVPAGSRSLLLCDDL